MRYLGQRSYAIYVFHMGCLIVMKAWYRINWQMEDERGVMDVVACAAGVVICLVLAEVSWYCLEQPFLRLKKYFPRYGVPAGERGEDAEPALAATAGDA